jgi:hypothetical protein
MMMMRRRRRKRWRRFEGVSKDSRLEGYDVLCCSV